MLSNRLPEQNNRRQEGEQGRLAGRDAMSQDRPLRAEGVPGPLRSIPGRILLQHQVTVILSFLCMVVK